MARFFFFPILILLLTGCHDVKKQQQLDDLSQMLSQVDRIQQTYKQNYTDTLPQLLARVKGVEAAIKQQYTGDTIDLELGRKLEAYKFIQENLPALTPLSKIIVKRSAEERETLLKLQQDIRNGIGDRSKYDSYISLEQNKVAQLDVMLRDWVNIQQQCGDAYRQFHVEMEAYSTQLKSGHRP